jgi:hypothetical protein
MKNKLHLGIIALAGLLLAHSALANTITVTNLADSGPGTLRAAIPATSAGGTINFQAGLMGTITLTSGELDINHNLTITGPGTTNLTVNGNNSSRVFNITNTTVSISGLTITGGAVQGATGNDSDPSGGPGQGGGIINSGNLTLTNCTIIDNSAVGGQGVVIVVSNGAAFGFGGDGIGGGIYSSGTLTLVNCLVTSNTVTGGGGGGGGGSGNGLGGGIFAQGAVALTNCTFSINSANGEYGGLSSGSGSGGGLYLAAGSVVNCTIANNSAVGGNPGFLGFYGPGLGGGIYVNSTGVTLIGCTISGNACYSDIAGAKGGGIYAHAAPTLKNTIVSGNVDLYLNSLPNIGPDDVNGSVTSGGYNFIGVIDGSSGWNITDLTGSVALPLDPQLGLLQNNGGPTPTMALSFTSPAINQGKSFGLTTDQRGYPRPFPYSGVADAPGGDGSDIGAYELSSLRPGLVIKILASQFVEIIWPYLNPGDPVYGLEVLTNGDLSSGAEAWTEFRLPVRLFNNQFVARDRIVQKGPGQGAGTSPMGSVYRGSSGVTNASFIAPPSTLPASSITATNALLNGLVTPAGSNTVWWFEYGTDTNYGSTTMTNSLTTSTIPASLDWGILGLAPLTLYHCQIVVTDDWSAEWGFQYGGDQTFTTRGYPPAVVTSVATSITTTSAVLTGTVDGNNTAIAGYFEYGAVPNGPPCCTDPTVIFTNTSHFYGPANTTVQIFNVPINGLSPYTTYDFYIVAFNGGGEAIGMTNTFTTASLPPPTVVTQPATYTGVGNGDFAHFPILNGTVNGNGLGFYGYFEFGLNTNSYIYQVGGFTGTNNSPQSFSFTMTGVTLNASTTYHYRIVGLSIDGASEADGGDQTFLSPP